jgi:hypothetical protein
MGVFIGGGSSRKRGIIEKNTHKEGILENFL